MVSLALAETALRMVRAAGRLGRRYDDIRLRAILGEPLPFKLPPPPDNVAEFVDEMESYFQQSAGRDMLVVEHLDDDFERYIDPSNPVDLRLQDRLVRLYLSVTGRSVAGIGSNGSAGSDQALQLSLTGYLQESAKPGSNRSAFLDVIVATSDVVAEYVADHPGLLTRNETAQNALRAFLARFADGDLEDKSFKTIFEQTLTAVVETALDYRELLDNHVAVDVVLDALRILKDEHPDFVERLASGDDFEFLVQALLASAAENTDHFVDDDELRDVIASILGTIAEDEIFNDIFSGNDRLAIVANVFIGEIARMPVLTRVVDGQPAWLHVMQSVADTISDLGDRRMLFTDTAIASISRTALIAAARESAPNQSDLAAALIDGVADAVESIEANELFTRGTIRAVIQQALVVSSQNLDLVIRNPEFVHHVLAAVLEHTAEHLGDRVDRELIGELFDEAIQAAAGNLELLGVPEQYAEIIGVLIVELLDSEFSSLLTRDQILDVVGDVLRIVAANPEVWARLENIDALAGVVRSILIAALGDPTKLLRGDVLVEAIAAIILAVVRHIDAFGEITDERQEDLLKLLRGALNILKHEIGRLVAADNIVEVLMQLVLEWGMEMITRGEAFSLAPNSKAFKERILLLLGVVPIEEA